MSAGNMTKAGRTAFTMTGRGAPIVLIHGVGMRNEIWAPQTEDLARDYTVIAYDMLGHGGSDVPAEGVTLADFAAQLLELLDHLHFERTAVAGHSMGALVALEFALTHPERTRGVVAMNAVFCRTPEESEAVGRRAAALTDSGPAANLPETLKRWFDDPPPPSLRDTAERVGSYLRDVDPDGYRRAYSLFARSDRAHERRLEALAMPALFLTAEHDPNSKPEMSRAMADVAPQGRAVIVPHARHMLPLTHAERVNAELRAFIASLPG